jgi:hypothetical protein
MHVFLAAIRANWPQHMQGHRDDFFFNFCYKKIIIKRIYTGLFEVLSVLDHFDDELGGEDNKI